MSGMIGIARTDYSRLCRTWSPPICGGLSCFCGSGLLTTAGRESSAADVMMLARAGNVHRDPQARSPVRLRTLTARQLSPATLSLVTPPVMPPAAPPGTSPVLSPVTGTIPLDTKLLTYIELGAALGITPASAKRLAIRKG